MRELLIRGWPVIRTQALQGTLWATEELRFVHRAFGRKHLPGLLHTTENLSVDTSETLSVEVCTEDEPHLPDDAKPHVLGLRLQQAFFAHDKAVLERLAQTGIAKTKVSIIGEPYVLLPGGPDHNAFIYTRLCMESGAAV